MLRFALFPRGDSTLFSEVIDVPGDGTFRLFGGIGQFGNRDVVISIGNSCQRHLRRLRHVCRQPGKRELPDGSVDVTEKESSINL